jgi:hypothetical protein
MRFAQFTIRPKDDRDGQLVMKLNLVSVVIACRR